MNYEIMHVITDETLLLSLKLAMFAFTQIDMLNERKIFGFVRYS